MIGKLTGLVDSLGEDWAIIDVHGVGYIVFASSRTLGALPARGEAVALFIETHVREDHIHLFGFAEANERDWFRLLCTVQGVGAKVGLAVLSALAPDEILQAIAAQDKTVLIRASGVGLKLAQRITIELKDKAGGFMLGPASSRPAGQAGPLRAGPQEDAVSALVNLGYGRADAFAAVARALGETGDGAGDGTGAPASVELLIKAGLKELTA
jgi:Holliday junction DNA helicase RuvA